MNQKRVLSLVLSLCVLLTILAPAANAVTWERKTTGSNRENVLFELLDNSLFDLDIYNNLFDNDLKIEKIDENEMVKVLIIMDGLSVVETDAKAVYGADTQEMMDALTLEQNAIVAAIEENLLGGESLSVKYSYTWLLNGVSTEIPYGLLSEIEAMDGVKQVLLQPMYEVCEATQTTVQPMTITGGSMIGREDVWADGYTGKGITIAVIDTGLDDDHQNFQALPEEALTEDSYNEDSIAAVLEQLKAYERNQDITAAQLYRSTKVVFGFNYGDDSLDISHDNDTAGDHGTHVAGIAAANKVEGSEVVGVAPDAQLMIMKVFGLKRAGYTEDILAALEDAMMLGADVINMSLGTNAGFTTHSEEVDAIYARVAETGAVLAIAAGNNYTAGYGNTWGTDANQTMYPDNAVISEPGIYQNALSIASVNNSYIQRNYIAAGERKLAYVETSASYGIPSVLDLEGAYPVVVIPGFGAPEDFEGLDLTGKIALIQRGTISFLEKCQNADAAGAVACIVYNNVEAEFGMDLTDCTATIPCISITMSDGEYLIASVEENPSMTISFPHDLTSIPSLVGYQMSDFSSWGVAPDLSLEPDITAPGGSVYSTINNGEYGLMSGTSMATPNLSGLAALVMQYLNENCPEVDIPTRELVQYLLVSTSAPLVYDQESGLYYSPRHQGSGLANAFDAIRSKVYLYTQDTDTPKAELGDDPERTGSYSFSFQVVNFGASAAFYRLRTVVQTEDFMTLETYPDRYFMSGTPIDLAASTTETAAGMVLTHDLNEDGVTNSRDAYLLYQKTLPTDAVVDADYLNEQFRYDVNTDEEVSMDDVQAYLNALVGLESEADLQDQVLKVEAGETAEISVSIQVEDAGKEYLDTYFVNGGYVEGFTFLEAENARGVDLSLPFLGFYGSWDEAPILDDGFYWDYLDSNNVTDEEEPEEGEDGEEGEEGEEGEDGEDGEEGEEDEDFDDDELMEDAIENTVVGNQYINVLWTQFYGYESYFYPGFNAYVSEEFDLEHISISPNDDGFVDTIDDIYLSMLRNARYMTFRYVDRDTGEVYYDYTVEYVSKSCYNANYGQIIPTVYTWYEGMIPMYGFTGADGETLPNNTRLMLQVEAKGDYENAGIHSWEVPITIDLEAPELVNLEKVTTEDGKVMLELTFRDNLSVAAVSLMDSKGKEVFYVEGTEDPEPDENGYRNYTASFDITDISGKLMIVIADYALNESLYALNLGGAGTPYGDLVAYQYNFNDEIYGWLSFSEGVEADEVQINMEATDIVAAEYINGFVFAQDENGALYGFRYEDMLEDTFDLETTYIAHLDNVYSDFAYSYVDGTLYGIASDDFDGDLTTNLYTINLHGAYYDEAAGENVEPYQETWYTGRGQIYGISLAIDDEGTFYILGVNGDDKTELWTSYESRYGTLFKKRMDVDVNMDYAQSMTYDHNTGTLYWAQFYPTSMFDYESGLYILDVENDTCELVGTLSGETCGMFAPLTDETVASDPIYTNVPEMDRSRVGQPILRKDVVSLNVGGEDTLIYDLDPWYTQHKDVIWSSSDESIVSVDQDGNIKALKKGTAVITLTAKDDSSLYDTCTVNVTELTLEIEGIFSQMGAGVGNAGGAMLYKFALEKGIESLITSHSVTAPEDLNFGLDIATSVYGRGYLWASEYGNTGMIYQIDPETGEVVDALMPMGGDMLFGMTYNEELDTFTGIMNMYLFVDLEFTHEEEQLVMDSYSTEHNAFMYHRINMLDYLLAAGGNFVTGEYGQGASSEIVMCGITNLGGGYVYVDTGVDYLGEEAVDSVNYTATQTLVVLDNVGRLWYIDEICGMTKTSSGSQVTYSSADGSQITYYGSYRRDGIIEMDNGDGTYNVFYIRTIEETPLTDMFRDGSMPRITYHFSDIEFGGFTSDGAPIFALSLYDYWNNGVTSELYLYTPAVTENGTQVAPERLYYLGNTGAYNVIASIHHFAVLAGLED